MKNSLNMQIHLIFQKNSMIHDTWLSNLRYHLEDGFNHSECRIFTDNNKNLHFESVGMLQYQKVIFLDSIKVNMKKGITCNGIL